ncbi:MAG: aminotransferase class IV family protein [Planctomycetaceae bacterium]|nr:aminotransferase class IV family protein [Planctomycetaceae bacterium]MCB9953352.1 aminotransferase class IV [Planctomycetaceae bacterium]
MGQISPDEPMAFLNGELIPFSEARIPVYDRGLVQGATVTERLRTVNGKPNQVDEHLLRLEQSLDLVGWDDVPPLQVFRQAIDDVAAHNTKLLGSGDDLSVVVFVTAGPFVPDMFPAPQPPFEPTVCVHAAPLPQQAWQPLYRDGVHLYVTGARQIPPECIDPRVKHRSRLNWHLIDRDVRRQDPSGVALLVDESGFVTETSSANLFVVESGRLYTPRREKTLHGITQSTVMTLAREAGLEVTERDISLDQLLETDEIFLTSSTFLIMPATRCNSRSIGTGLVGTVTKQLSGLLRESFGLGSLY